MPPAKKTTSAAKRSRVAGGAEDDVITDAPRPAEAEDPTQSSRAKDELFGDAPKTAEGQRTEEPLKQEDVVASKPEDAVETPLLPAHATDENPEDHIGDEIKDPWSDDSQTDWPNNETAEGVSN